MVSGWLARSSLSRLVALPFSLAENAPPGGMASLKLLLLPRTCLVLSSVLGCSASSHAGSPDGQRSHASQTSSFRPLRRVEAEEVGFRLG